MIRERNVCCQCKYMASQPLDPDFKFWESYCLMKSEYFNHSGGLTDCRLFEEE